MECKAGLYTGISADTAVLIETLWNVKPHSTSVGWIFLSEVLIETLWNVKIRQGVLLRISGISINRNIVECKGKKRKSQSIIYNVLIETLWNVKLRMQNIMIFSPDLVLIETLWNVKYMKNGTMQDLGAVLIETLWNVKIRQPE